jgi:hypothetical protein
MTVTYFKAFPKYNLRGIEEEHRTISQHMLKLQPSNFLTQIKSANQYTAVLIFVEMKQRT